MAVVSHENDILIHKKHAYGKKYFLLFAPVLLPYTLWNIFKQFWRIFGYIHNL